MYLLSIVLLCWLSTFASSLSPSKNHSRPMKVSGPRPSDCKDEISQKVCKKYEKYCDISESLKTLCKRTCGYCRAVSPLPCQNFPFGCCWDGVSIAAGPGQKGCPACKDTHKKCYVLAKGKNCQITSVKRACPVSCGLCPSCQDHPDQRDYCPFFKKSGSCENMKDFMKIYCKKTCNLCSEK